MQKGTAVLGAMRNAIQKINFTSEEKILQIAK